MCGAAAVGSRWPIAPSWMCGRHCCYRIVMLAVYAIVHGNEAGWTSAQTLCPTGIAIALMIAFLAIESRVCIRSCRCACSRCATWPRPTWWRAVGGCAVRVFFISAVHAALAELQRDAGGAGVPTGQIIMAVFSAGAVAKLVMRFGIRAPLSLDCWWRQLGLVLLRAHRRRQLSCWTCCRAWC